MNLLPSLLPDVSEVGLCPSFLTCDTATHDGVPSFGPMCAGPAPSSRPSPGWAPLQPVHFCADVPFLTTALTTDRVWGPFLKNLLLQCNIQTKTPHLCRVSEKLHPVHRLNSAQSARAPRGSLPHPGPELSCSPRTPTPTPPCTPGVLGWH